MIMPDAVDLVGDTDLDLVELIELPDPVGMVNQRVVPLDQPGFLKTPERKGTVRP